MPRISPVTSSRCSELYQQADGIEPIDPIPNMSGTLAYSQVAFTAYLQGHQLALEVEKILGERLANLFACSVAVGSDCPLCAAYFRKRISLIDESSPLAHKGIAEKPLLDFANSIARHRGNIADHIFDPVREMLTDEEIITLVAFAGMIMAASVFNNVIETEMDEQLLPFQPPLYQLR